MVTNFQCSKCGASQYTAPLRTFYQHAPGLHMCSTCVDGVASAPVHDVDLATDRSAGACANLLGLISPAMGEHPTVSLICGEGTAGPCDNYARQINGSVRSDHCVHCGWVRAFHEKEFPTLPPPTGTERLIYNDTGTHEPTGDESQARQVIRDRCADWSRRSDKWHDKLDRARRMVADGDKAPAAVSAIAAMLAWSFQRYAALFPLAATFVIALISWRARIGKADLDDSHTEQCWLIADRMSEFYRGLIAQFGIVDDQVLLNKSQAVESESRIGLPDRVREAIAGMVRVS